MDHSLVIKPSRWLMQQARQARVWVLLSIGLGLASGILLILQASLLSYIVNAVFIAKLPRDMVWHAFLGMLGIIMIRAGLAWVRETVGFHASARVRQEVREQLWHKIKQLGPVRLQQVCTSAEASNHLIEQTEALHNYFAYYLPQMALAVLLPLVILFFVFPLSWLAGVILLVTAPLIPLFMALVGMGASALNRKNFQALSRMSAQFLDVLRGLTTLKLFGQSQGEVEHIAHTTDQYRRTTMSVLRVAFLSSSVLELFSSVAIAILATYLGLSLLGFIHIGHYSGALSLGSALFILLLAPDFYLPLRELATQYHARAEAVGAAEEMLKVLQAPVPKRPRKVPFTEVSQIAIDFHNVGFCYPDRQVAAVHDATFQLKPGMQTALVGPSGAGKTTILNLLLGFIQPQTGTIHINGQDMADIDLDQWRHSVAWVSQHSRLFYGTIRDNICLGCARVDEQALQQAIDAAYVSEFLDRLPQGLDTMVGEGNSGLSGGQVQRIVLARAYLKGAPLLLLDEPTASLDAQSEQWVLKALQQVSANRTVLMLTHRLKHIQTMQQVVVLSHGELVQQGSYAQLARRKGLFKELLTQGAFADA